MRSVSPSVRLWYCVETLYTSSNFLYRLTETRWCKKSDVGLHNRLEPIQTFYATCTLPRGVKSLTIHTTIAMLVFKAQTALQNLTVTTQGEGALDTDGLGEICISTHVPPMSETVRVWPVSLWIANRKSWVPNRSVPLSMTLSNLERRRSRGPPNFGMNLPINQV